MLDADGRLGVAVKIRTVSNLLRTALDYLRSGSHVADYFPFSWLPYTQPWSRQIFHIEPLSIALELSAGRYDMNCSTPS